ncbi:PLP-dependent transferase [Wilcoxina mikolae CBS 423.85]|nr:PLP-dependent transferase [Wilcoxina mikolae CBS 423.85]
MSLAKHIDPDELIASLREDPPKHRPLAGHDGTASHRVYGGRYQAALEIPKFRLPDAGTNSHSIYQLIHDELDLDGRPNLNLASFVNTFMDPYADKLMAENIGKNLADADEYPIVQAIHARCISILGNLWNVPKGETAIGTATTGSSEAIHLGGLAMKRIWQNNRREKGKTPFTNATNGLWDFRLPRVHSISTSGHKFGLVYPGLGWQIWRSEKWLPKELIFELHYLGGTEQTFTLNFSRPSAQVIAQYYNFLSLGRDGYTSIMHNSLRNARLLSKTLEASGWFTCVSGIHKKCGTWEKLKEKTVGGSDEAATLYQPGLPVVAFRFSDAFKSEFPHVKQQSINYALPPNGQDIEILRVVVRESMSADLLDMLIADILSTTETLISSDSRDVECFARPQAPRIEKDVTSLGRNKWLEKGKDWLEKWEKEMVKKGKEKDKKKEGVFNSTC